MSTNEPVAPTIGTEPNQAAEAQAALKNGKFQKRGFAKPSGGDERSMPINAGSPQEDVTAQNLPESIVIDIPDENLEPDQIASGDPKTADTVVAKDEGDIAIGGKTFKTQKEAWAYAEELERKQVADDAFRQGVELASQAALGNQPKAPPAPVVEEEIPIDVMYDPKKLAKWVTEKAAKAKDDAKREMVEAQTQKVKNENLWTDFYSAYPDLAVAKDLVDLHLQKNWARLEHVNVGVALKELATIVRGEVTKIRQAGLPSRDLPRVTTGASSGTAEVVTTAKPAEKALNMVSQMRNLKNKRAGKR